MDGYKAYRKDGILYVDRTVAPMFTMEFTARKDGQCDGRVLDDTQINRFVRQSEGSEVQAVSRWMREAGDCALEFLKREKSN